MYRLENSVRNYAWGSTTAIPEFLGVPPDGKPQAELWVGAHPSAPSLAHVDSALVPLDELIASDPVTMLGENVAARFGELPFLLKFLSAASPLSIQAHPSTEQAIRGFARENEAGIPIDSPLRIYKDDRAKPETLYATSEFELLCGFRDPAKTVDFYRELAIAALADAIAILQRGDAGRDLHDVLELFFTFDQLLLDRLVTRLGIECTRCNSDEFVAERNCIAQLSDIYPGDVGVLVATLLNHVVLGAGHAIFLRDRMLHSYVGGVGIELMANSDNVIRGGLTPKHVDTAELVELLRYGTDAGLPIVQRQSPTRESVIDVPVPDLRMSILELDASRTALDQWGPDLVIALDGRLDLLAADGSPPLTLPRGSTAFIPASTNGYTVSGAGKLVRATVAS